MRSQWVGFGLIVGSAVGFGLMPIFATMSYAAGLSVHTVLLLRFALAAILLAPLAWREARHHPQRITRRGVVWCLLLGAVLYTGEALTYFYAVKLLGPGLAAVLLYLYPALVAATTCVQHRRWPSRWIVISLVVSFVGVAAVIGPVSATARPFAVAIGVLAAFVYAFYVVMGHRLTAGTPPIVLTELLFCGSVLGLGVTGLGWGQLHLDFDPSGWIWVVGLAVVASVVGILFFFLGMVRIGPTRAAIVSTIEPVVAVVVAVPWLGQSLMPWQILGVVLVLVGALMGMLASPQVRARTTDVAH